MCTRVCTLCCGRWNPSWLWPAVGGTGEVDLVPTPQPVHSEAGLGERRRPPVAGESQWGPGTDRGGACLPVSRESPGRAAVPMLGYLRGECGFPVLLSPSRRDLIGLGLSAGCW